MVPGAEVVRASEGVGTEDAAVEDPGVWYTSLVSVKVKRAVSMTISRPFLSLISKLVRS